MPPRWRRPSSSAVDTSELDFIRASLPETQIERVQQMVAGARHCAYEIRAGAAA
jgi:predicted ArsR family transcriptional regulator